MSEMVEHVARALIEARCDHEAMPAYDYLRMARAAIAAMHEPTEEMLEKSHLDWSEAAEAWRKMIDAALTQ